MKTEFAARVHAAVERNDLPVAAVAALGRIDSVRVHLSDRLLNMNSLTLGHVDHTGRVSIYSDELRTALIPHLTHVLTHEFMHELSGKSITARTTTEADGYSHTYHYYRKVGVALKSPELPYAPNEWLNEAITEWLALRISEYRGDTDAVSYQGSNSYPEERKELDRLRALGLEDEIITNAYFENFSSEGARGEKGKHFARLVQRINELEGKYGFTRIENVYIMNKIELMLYRHGVYDENRVSNMETLSPGTELFTLHIAVGIAEDSISTRNFLFAAIPIDTDSTAVSVEEQWAHVVPVITDMKRIYGPKVAVEVTRTTVGKS